MLKASSPPSERFRTLSARFAVAAMAFLAGSPAKDVRAADDALVAAARQEGEVVWLGTQALNDLARPLIDAFEAKYRIKVLYNRNTVGDIILKVSTEAAAGKQFVDVVDGTFTSPALKKMGLIAHWLPDAATRFPAEFVDPEGCWIAMNIYVATPAYNTDLVTQATRPNTLQDLLDPRWRHKMVWSSVTGSATGAGFIGAVLKELGDDAGMDFLRRLAQQDITGVHFPARTVLDQVIVGDYPLMLQNFNSQVVVARAKGAPVDWIPMLPATGVLTLASVLERAPHPNAARLLLDFLVSPEGQAVFRQMNYIPADPAVPPLDPSVRPDGARFRAIYYPPEEVEARMPKWMEIFDQLFR